MHFGFCNQISEKVSEGYLVHSTFCFETSSNAVLYFFEALVWRPSANTRPIIYIRNRYLKQQKPIIDGTLINCFFHVELRKIFMKTVPNSYLGIRLELRVVRKCLECFGEICFDKKATEPRNLGKRENETFQKRQLPCYQANKEWEVKIFCHPPFMFVPIFWIRKIFADI